MVLDARPLEDAARIGGAVIERSLRAALLGALFLLSIAGVALAEALAVSIAPYLRARDERAVGEVVGQAHGDPRRPTSPPIPYDGVSVLLLPYSAALDSELDAIREHYRDSLRNFMEAAADVTDARTTYEQALLWAGGGELIRGAVSDATGTIRLVEVPAGDWMMLGWRERVEPGRPARPRSEGTAGFRDVPVHAGHSLVRYWRTRLRVSPGEVATMDLNDRNVWMTGVREDVYLTDGPARKSKPRNRR